MILIKKSVIKFFIALFLDIVQFFIISEHRRSQFLAAEL